MMSNIAFSPFLFVFEVTDMWVTKACGTLGKEYLHQGADAGTNQ